MRTPLIIMALLITTIANGQTTIVDVTVSRDTTISVRAWYVADSIANHNRSFAAGYAEGLAASVSTDGKIDSVYGWLFYAVETAIPDQYKATSDFYKYFDKLIAATKQYNDPIIRTSLSASALATLTQSFPPSTLILAVSKNANGTTNLTYQTVKP